jgi:arylsulfatase A-like enzyme
MRVVNVYPIVYAFAGLALLRTVVLIGLHVQARMAGMAEPGIVLVWGISLHVGVTLLECAILLWAQFFLRWRIVAVMASIVVVVLFVWTLADPIIFTLAGDHLTPSLLAHFAGFRIFTSDYLWQPLRAHPVLVISGLAGIAVLITACAICCRASVRAVDALTLKSCVLVSCAGAALVVVPAVAGASFIEAPAEIIYAFDAIEHRQLRPQDIAGLRSFVGLPAGGRWLDDRYPLVYAPAKRSIPPPSRPDIVVISIESLRGQDLRWVTGRPDGIILPSLEALARRAVVFPNFVANGFPSTEGFIATSASTWPHDRRRIVIDFNSVNFDFMSARLRSLGYRTVRIEDDPNLEEDAPWIQKAFDEWITFAGNRLPVESQMVARIAEFVAQHDRERAAQPLLLDWKTANPHMPYHAPGDPPGGRPHSTPESNYPRTLKTVDAAIGELLSVLAARSRAHDTIVLVLGDHSNWVNSSRTTALPSDEMIWTGAMIAGEAPWVGRARRSSEHASQVDIMPTVMALAGDDRPTAALGRDLLARDPLRPVRAVAVRPGGLRIDENGSTTLMDRRHLHGGMRTRAFSTERQPMDAMTGSTLARHVETWSRVIEEDRVWNPKFLD